MWLLSLALGCTGDVASSPVERSFNHDENGLWARRVWLHEARTDAELDALVATLRARGINRLYPFLGPPDASGAPAGASRVRVVPAPSVAPRPTVTGAAGRGTDGALSVREDQAIAGDLASREESPSFTGQGAG